MWVIGCLLSESIKQGSEESKACLCHSPEHSAAQSGFWQICSCLCRTCAENVFLCRNNSITHYCFSMFRLQKKYLLWALFLFTVEVIIAVFVHDRFVRPFGGDFLVVILLYCFVKGFWDAPDLKVAVAVLLFAYLIEVLQYFHIVKILGLEHSKVATIVIGNAFEWTDILAYTLGVLGVLWAERIWGMPSE